MKKRDWFLIGVVTIVIVISYLTAEKKIMEFFVLKKQQQRIEQNIFIVFQTITQYNRLFGSIPSTFKDNKLMSLLKENLKDSLVLTLRPNISHDSKTGLFHVYLNGPDGKNDTLKKIINENYIPAKTEILKISFIQYCFSKGDITLGSLSYSKDCDERSRRFLYIDKEEKINVENDSVRKKIYYEIGLYIKCYFQERKIKPSSKSYFAYCSFKFDKTKVNYDVLCVREGNVETINSFIAKLANYLRDKNIGVKEVYFPIYINEALIMP